MNTPFNKTTEVVCFHKLSTFVNVMYETEGYDTGDSKLLPLSVYHEWLQSTGRLRADFSITHVDNSRTVECDMTTDDYWNDTDPMAICADLREYYLALAGEDDERAVDIIGFQIRA